MAVMDSSPAIWEEIERSESYLVVSMYEEAATVASSVLRRICHNNAANQGIEGFELNDMKVSAGMVLVQSLNQLGRACFVISDGSSLGVKEFLEEFPSVWHSVEEKYCVLVRPRVDANVPQGCEDGKFLGIDEYMNVVEINAITLAGTALKNLVLSIALVEKAALPGERRQGLFRKLHSSCTLSKPPIHEASQVCQQITMKLVVRHQKNMTFLRDHQKF